jgi:hypothetical protein
MYGIRRCAIERGERTNDAFVLGFFHSDEYVRDDFVFKLDHRCK